LHGFDKKEGIVEVLLNYQNLEAFLVVGGITIVSGILIGGTIFLEWFRSGFGKLNEIANAVLSLSLIIIGLEVIFMAIFISMMCLNDESCPQ
jgi:hypothetical protein